MIRTSRPTQASHCTLQPPGRALPFTAESRAYKNAALPGNAREFFERIQTPQKRLLWGTEPHFDFYDREASKMAANEVASHFKATL
jgi:hypothetical protein